MRRWSVALVGALLTLAALPASAAPQPAPAPALPALPAYLRVIDGQDQNAGAGLELSAPITYRTQPGTPLALTLPPGFAVSASGGSLVADAGGRIRVTLRTPTLPGTYLITASVAGLAQPVTTTVTVLPYLQLNPRYVLGRALSAETIDAAGSGVLLMSQRDVRLGAAGDRWRSYRLDVGARGATSIPFPDEAEASLSGWAARDSAGTVHAVYDVVSSASLGGASMRYSRFADGAWSPPVDLPDRGWVIDADLVPDEAGGADLVYSTLAYEVRRVGIGPEGIRRSDSAVSGADALAAWPSAVRFGADLAVAYTRFDERGSFIRVALGEGERELAHPNVAAGTLSVLDGSLALVYADGLNGVWYAEIGDRSAAGEPTGLTARSYDRPGRAVTVGGHRYVVTLADGGLAVAERSRRGFADAFTLADLTDLYVETLSIARTADADGRLPVVVGISSGNGGGTNHYLVPLALGGTCVPRYDRGEHARGVGNAQGVRGNGRCWSEEVRTR